MNDLARATVTEPIRRSWARPRFSIGGLLIITLGVGVGLGCWRVPGASVTDALLGTFAAWFAIGMLQESLRDWRLANGGERTSGAVAALAIALVVPICVFVSGINRNLSFADDSREFLISRATKEFGDAAILLAICCGYWLTGKASRSVESKRSRWNTAVTVAVLLVAAFWVSWLVLSETMVTSLVHVAVQGVENAQPTKWKGQVIREWSPRDDLNWLFVRQAYLCVALMLGSVAFVVALCGNWQRGLMVRTWLFGAAAACITGVISLVVWCHSVLPRIAPLEAEFIGAQPFLGQVQALVLIVIATTTVTWRLTASRSPEVIAAGSLPTSADWRPLHLCSSVILLGILVILWQFWDAIELSALFTVNFFSNFGERVFGLARVAAGGLEQPMMLLQLALLCILLSRLWRNWSGDRVEARTQWSLNRPMFMVAWLLLFFIGLATPAVAAWYGVALYLQLGMT